IPQDQKEILIQDLINMSPAEREATLTSLQQGVQIQSKVTRRVVHIKQLNSVKDAKKEINDLLKKANKSIKAKKFNEAIQFYETAEVTASQWNLKKLAQELRDKILNIQIQSYNYIINSAKKNIKILLKSNKIEEALTEAQKGLDASSQMFKLGFTEYDKKVKEFQKYINELNINACETDVSQKETETSSKLMKQQKQLLKRAIKLEKAKKYQEAIAAYSELATIADKLFKCGVTQATSEIKKYNSKIKSLKAVLKKEIESGKASDNEEALLDQKSKMLNIALEAEKSEDYIRAIVAYQQVLNIYYTLGDLSNARPIEDKIKKIISLIPNINEILSQLIDSAENNFQNGEYEKAFGEFQYAKSLSQAIGDVSTLKKIDKRLSELEDKI
ncbi:MAG: hypothetical protein ACTSXF_00435, partial [Promethearchaeota archaeon]